MLSPSTRRMILLLAFLGAPFVQAADITDIEVEVTMSREVYRTGESISVIVTQCNPTDETITQQYGCPCCHDQMLLLDFEQEQIGNCSGGCISAVVTEIWQPGECKSRTYTPPNLQIDCDLEEPLSQGTYQARHIFDFNNTLGYQLITDGPVFVVNDAAIAVPSLSWVGILTLVAALIAAACYGLRRSPSSTP